MEFVQLVYKTDAWHSNSSWELIGVASDQDHAIEICKARAKQEGEYIDAEQLSLLDTIKQTQNYSGEGEFLFEVQLLDCLI